MSENNAKKIKFIPKLSQIEATAKQLPSPNTADDDVFSAKISGTSREIVFERIEVQNVDGSKAYKWTYKGRMFIDSHFQNAKK